MTQNKRPADELKVDAGQGPGSERRIFTRATGLLSGCIVIGRVRIDCAVLDLSLQGAKIELDRLVTEDELPALKANLKLRLACPTDLSVEVVRHAGTQLGLRFLDPAYQVARVLESVLPEDCQKLSPTIFDD